MPQYKTYNFIPSTGAPITTTTADTLEKGSWGLSHRVEYLRNSLLTEEQLIAAPFSENQQASLINYLMWYYGLEKNITIGVTVPFTYLYNIQTAQFDENGFFDPTVVRLGSPSGISDTNIYSLWRIFRNEDSGFSTAFLAGLDVPTGKTSVRASDGLFFAAADQPGNGGWTPFVGIAITKERDKLALSANLLYSQDTEGVQQTTLGSIFNYNLAAVLKLHQNDHTKFSVSGVLELNGEYTQQDMVEGFSDPNTGGTSLFLAPGIRIDKGSMLSVYFCLNVPVFERYNGTQVKTQYGATGGIDLSF